MAHYDSGGRDDIPTLRLDLLQREDIVHTMHHGTTV